MSFHLSLLRKVYPEDMLILCILISLSLSMLAFRPLVSPYFISSDKYKVILLLLISKHMKGGNNDRYSNVLRLLVVFRDY